MDLQLQNLLPLYFDESRKQSSEIWGKNLHFTKGELIKIVAPSGSGKTSLIHFLYGIRHDYSGTIAYNENSIKKFGAEELATYRKKNASIVFQDLRLFPDLSVYENIDIKRQLNPLHPVERIKDMAERLGIGSKLKSKSKICSYGEQQRIAIIRSLMQPFEILLLDEPFSHLDTVNAKIAMQLILQEAQMRSAMIVFADLERIDYFPYTSIFHL